MKLLIGGSPCTHWSIAQTKNRETEPEGLGWELFKNYLIALEKFKPDYFLYENNKSMSAAIREQITKELGVEPILINSGLVSAQNRQRLYWTNIPGVEQPEDLGLILRDILESGIPLQEKAYTLKAQYYKNGMANFITNGGFAATAVAEPVRIGTIESDAKNADFDSQQYRVYSPDGKSVTLCGKGGGVGAKTGLYDTPICINQLASGKSRTVDAHMGKLEKNLVPRINDPNPAKQQYDCIIQPIRVGDMPNAAGEVSGRQSGRIYSVDGKGVPLQARPNGGGADGAATGLYAVPTPIEYNPLQSCDVVVTDQNIRCTYKDGSGTAQGYTVYFDDVKGPSVIAGHAHKMKIIEPATGKEWPVYEVRDGQITIKGKQYPIKLADGFYIIRKLTVTECKRLQTVPEEYIFPVSDTQAYKMLGNGWTVDVIAHILHYAPGITEEPLEVLSMYDGMSCGHLALDKLGAHIAHYYATEIDKYAVQTTQHNFPDTIQLGDAFQVRDDGWSLPGLTVEESVATPEAEAVEEPKQAEPEETKETEERKAAPLEIVPMTLREANAYVEQNHRHHGPVAGHKYSIGLSDGEKIVGVAIVGRPVSRHLDDGWTLEVNRLCTDGTKNACSMLYAAAWRAARAMGYKRLITYILESENGASLRAAGWKCVGQAGGLRWTGERRPEVDLYPAQMKIRFEQTVSV